jgi:HK97 family phage portal protein
MTPEQKDGAIIYNYLYEDGKKVAFPAEKIWHVKNMPISASYSGSMPEGIVGLSPISIAQEAVGIAMAADQYGGRYFANNAAVGMGLQYPDHIKLSPEAKNYLSEKLTEYSKTENKFKSIILDQGGKLEKIGMSNEDSQFLESRNFQVEEIARIYRVPPVLIGHPTNTMTYASAEQLFLSFATYTIRPWCVRLEQSMNRYLLPERERGKYFFEFKMDGLLRGDYAARMNGYAVARNWGLMNVDEIRALENMNPLPSGKGAIYLQPLNMVEAGTPPLAPTKLAEPTAQEGDKNNG